MLLGDSRDFRLLRLLAAPARLIRTRNDADDFEIPARRREQSIEDVSRQLGRAHENNFQRRRRVQIWTEGGLAFSKVPSLIIFLTLRLYISRLSRLMRSMKSRPSR